jgi:RHS repeat-associated protein
MEKDATSANHYDHARYYGAWLGRFHSPDQLGGKPEDPQSWNRYAYAKNNPLTFVDPDGRQAAPGQSYVSGQGWTTGSALDPANRPSPVMGMQFMAVTGAIGALTVFGGSGFVASFLGTHPTLAGWLGSIGLGMVGAPSPQQTLQKVASSASGELASNPALAKTVLSQAQYAAGQGTAGVARMQYGNAMEGLVAQQVQASPELSQMFRHVGGPNRPDFVGRIGSEAVGMTFDVTTTAAAAAHQARPYGLGLQLITYERPETFRLFP